MALAVVDSTGKLIASYGDPQTVAFLRSSAKPFQVLPFVERGGVEHFGFSPRELTLSCASHEGSDMHVQAVLALQKKVGVEEGNLMCGSIERGRTFIFLTDNELGLQHEGGLSWAQYVAFCRDADLVFHDAQYTDEDYKRTRGWGHSTFRDATDLAIEAGVKRLGLVHHDPDRADDDLDRQVEFCQERIRLSGSAAGCFAAAEGMVIEL